MTEGGTRFDFGGEEDARGRLLALSSRALARLPWSALRPLGAALGFLAGSLLRIRRRQVEQAMVSGGVSGPRRAARAMYRSLGVSVFEFLWLAGGDARRLARAVHVDEGSERAIEQVRALGRGVILCATHTGNWDLAACAMAQRIPLLVITKRLRVRWLDRFWQSTRSGYGVRLCEAASALREARAMLRAGGAVAMMIDQVPLRRRHAIPVDFFGRTAHADKAPAALAATTGAPLVVAGSRRGDDGRHHLSVLDVMIPPSGAGGDFVADATRRATCALEAFVRRHPSEWLWLHRRWRAPEMP